MAILSKGQTFANADAVTSTKLNNLVDAATFVTGASGTTDDSTLEVNGSGRLQIKDLGVTGAKFANGTITTAKLASSTGATDGVTYAKIQHVANMRVIGNTSGALAAPSEVSILDEDDMVSDSATSIPTQQSVRAYVGTATTAAVTANAFVPFAKAYCTVAGGTLTIRQNTGFASIVRNSAGVYTLTLSSTQADTYYKVLLQKEMARPLEGDFSVEFSTKTVNSFIIENADDNATPEDVLAFSVLVFS